MFVIRFEMSVSGQNITCITQRSGGEFIPVYLATFTNRHYTPFAVHVEFSIVPHNR